jgi:hypothetical protein
MKKSNVFIVILVILAMSTLSCKKQATRWKKEHMGAKRNYVVKHYSGGKLINTHRFKGVLLNQEDSDGYYYYKGDTCYDLSGDLEIISWK